MISSQNIKVSDMINFARRSSKKNKNTKKTFFQNNFSIYKKRLIISKGNNE